METTEVVTVESAPAAPVVTKSESSFSESKQETKVEQVTNGTVETATSQQKAVSQKVESSVQQTVSGESSSVTVQEVKQESFSSSSVVMEKVVTTGDGLVVSSVEPLPVLPSIVENVVVAPPQPQQQQQPPSTDVNNNVVASVPEPVKEVAPEPVIVKPVEVVKPTAPEPVVEKPAVVECQAPVVQQIPLKPTPATVQSVPAQPTFIQPAPVKAPVPAQPTFIQPAPVKAPVPAQPSFVQQAPRAVPFVQSAPVPQAYVPPPFTPEPIQPAYTSVAQTEAITKEIQQENIKKQLNEIITDIEQHVNVNDEEPAENSNEGKLDVTNPVDLQKIFTPAHDTAEILPGKNRKLFASSSFYSPTIHPTVEDQVALAQRISHSLSDISNQQSKGQCMYVNRKKRSVKWIHDNGGVEEQQFYEEQRETKENGFGGQMNGNVGNFNEPRKVPLKLLMDPRGQVHGYDPAPPAPMSPEFGIELVHALNASTGKGAELFAKRRKKAEKWVVDGSNMQQQRLPQTAPVSSNPSHNILAYSDVGTQRVHRNIQMDQIQDRYLNQQNRVMMVKSPWEAALETGSANNAFVNFNQTEMQQQQPAQIYSAVVGPNQQFEYGQTSSSFQSQGSQSSVQSAVTTKRDVQYQTSSKFSGNVLAYKPTVPQGWKRPIDLPKGTFIPPDLTTVVHSSSTSTEKISKFTSQSSSSTTGQQGVSFSSLPPPLEMSAPIQAPAPVVQAPAPIMKPQTPVMKPQVPMVAPQQQPPTSFMQRPQAQPPKPVQNSLPKSFPPPKSPVQFAQQPIQYAQPPKSPIHFNQAPPQPAQQPQQFQPKVCSAPPSKMSPISQQKGRNALNASPVTPGILKKQIQVDGAVPRLPGSGEPQSKFGPAPPKSPVPFLNTTPVPFGLQSAGTVQTAETLAQLAPISPAPASLPRSMQTPKPLPVIVNTPMPKYNTNYNLAASGFGVYKDYYRPTIVDGSKKLVPPVHYTDF